MLGELRSVACLENFETCNFQIKKLYYTAQKMKFFIKDLVTFTEKILNEKLHFLCSVSTIATIIKQLHPKIIFLEEQL